MQKSSPWSIAACLPSSPLAWLSPAIAATLRVPHNHKTLQAAIDASLSGDTILVVSGTYQDRIRLKQGLILRSVGDDAKRADCLKQAEVTIIDDGDNAGEHPGVMMAEASTGCHRPG